MSVASSGWLFPPSHSLTQTDRDYYNIIKTEDGLSKFFRLKDRQSGSNLDPLDRRMLNHKVAGSRPTFKYHKTFIKQKTNLNQDRQVAAVYLTTDKL